MYVSYLEETNLKPTPVEETNYIQCLNKKLLWLCHPGND